jgi:hypothetical protein
MTRDWNAEWDMEQSEVDDLIASMQAFQACDHDWVPTERVEDGTALAWLEFVCTKCGGGQGLRHSDVEEAACH